MADYISSGTVAATNGSATITGTSTTWVTDGVRAGDTIWIQPASGAPVSYPITAVASATGLTIGFNYGGTTGTGLSYLIERRFDQEKAADTYRLLNNYIASLETSASVGMSGILYSYAALTTMANPTSGKFRLNNASIASATAIAISDTAGEVGAPDISTFLNSWDDSTSTVKGLLILKKAGSPATFAIFSISALTDNSGWSQLTISYVAGAGTFSNEDDFRIEFYRTGDKGDTGLGLTAEGAWDDFSGSFAVNDIVSNNGDGWICIQAHAKDAGKEPGVSAGHLTYWTKIVSKGDSGTAYINVDGGTAVSTYGGVDPIDGGTA